MCENINSGIKIFTVIDILLSGITSRKEACLKLKEKGIQADIKTFSKYIRTLKAAKFDIKIQDKNINVIESPFKINFTKEEKRGYLEILLLKNSLFKRVDNDNFDVIDKKLRLLGKLNYKQKENETIPINIDFDTNEKVFKNIKKLNEYISVNPSKVELKYNKNKYIILPYSIKYKKNGVFLDCANLTLRKNHTINLSKVSSIKLHSGLNDEDKIGSFGQTVFKISGRLKKNYILKEGEVAKYTNDFMIVTNHKEEKEELFNRLTKYGKYCEVIYPLSDRNKFIAKIKNLIKHYKLLRII